MQTASQASSPDTQLGWGIVDVVAAIESTPVQVTTKVVLLFWSRL